MLLSKMPISIDEEGKEYNKKINKREARNVPSRRARVRVR